MDPPSDSDPYALGSVRMPGASVIAVDWSGAQKGVRRKLWLAEARDGQLVRLESGRTREELVAHLIQRAAADRDLVVGLDFAFSYPAWFVRVQGEASARELWALVEREGERWLSSCPPPFWGRKGRRRPRSTPERPLFRHTEGEHLPIAGIGPKSVFQIGGAGAVGTGSIRGMPHLLRLSRAGFAVWPFDPPREPLVIEIYPRWLSGAVTKGSAAGRECHIRAHCPGQPEELLERAASCDDAFDAAVSALAMSAHAAELPLLAPARSPDELLEGRIWRPAIDPLDPCSALRGPKTPAAGACADPG